MKTSILFILLLFNHSFLSIDKNEIYKALSGNSYQEIDQLIVKLDSQKSTSFNRIYKGSLIAKSASFEKSAAKKIAKFKTGIHLLETEIKDFPNNTEYRFLRLCIQEHCPKILKYNKNITEDVRLITTNFTKQSTQLKTIISSYAKTSKSLDYTLLK